MIIVNGYILMMRKKAEGGIDSGTGYPQPSTSEWGKPIPCQYTAKQYSYLATANGEHITSQQYEILIEEQPLPCTEQLRLHDRSGRKIGEYSIICVEPLDAVCELRIIV